MGRQAVGDALWLEVRQQADLTAAAVRLGKPAGPVVPHVAGVDLVLIVAPGHRVIDASKDARGLGSS